MISSNSSPNPKSSGSVGTGIIVGYSADVDKLYIITANHVIRQGINEATDISLEFSQLPLEHYSAFPLRHPVSNFDLTVIAMSLTSLPSSLSAALTLHCLARLKI
ncbi:MAG: hypothetical protein R2880_19470 [Deinococcales bacterium]